jgi:cytochrome c553
MKKILALSILVTAFATAAGYAATASDNWDNNCAKCHGADGSGSSKMGKRLKVKDYTDASVQAALKDEDMVKAIKDGVKDADGKDRMKGFKDDLSDPEVTDLVAAIRKMKK